MQLEFKWTSWLRRLKSRPVKARTAGGEDRDLTQWCAEAAAGLSLERLSKRVRVRWNGRMRTTAGRASWPDCLIELNPRLPDFGADEMWRTLKHELAHLVAYERCGRRRISPHGPEWRLACGDLGIAGESVCHELPFPRRRMKRAHVYECRHCHAVVERVRPIRRAVACYDCCRKLNRGYYHDRFKLVKRPPTG